MAEDNWQQARLIPTSGINGVEEAERRATSALLAVVGSVREFASALVKPLGAPAGQLDTYIEVPFKAGERTVYPDGVLQASRAGRTWTALVEVKTGSSELERPQVVEVGSPSNSSQSEVHRSPRLEPSAARRGPRRR